MKGIRKGFNKYISHIFVVKEREIEIGSPTDVKHVAHIGWEGSSATPPSWMTEFKAGPDFSSPSGGGVSAPGAPMSPRGRIDVSVTDLASVTCKWPQIDEEIMGRQVPQGSPRGDIGCAQKKHRRKKIKATSPRGSSSSSRAHHRGKTSKSRFANRAESSQDF